MQYRYGTVKRFILLLRTVQYSTVAVYGSIYQIFASTHTRTAPYKWTERTKILIWGVDRWSGSDRSIGSWDPSSIQIIAEKEKKRKRKEGGQEEEKESPPSQSLDPIQREAENGSLTQNRLRYYVQDEIDALLSAAGYLTFNTRETFKLLTHPIYLFRPDIRSVRDLNFVASTDQKFSTATWPKPCQRLWRNSLAYLRSYTWLLS